MGQKKKVAWYTRNHVTLSVKPWVQYLSLDDCQHLLAPLVMALVWDGLSVPDWLHLSTELSGSNTGPNMSRSGPSTLHLLLVCDLRNVKFSLSLWVDHSNCSGVIPSSVLRSDFWWWRLDLVLRFWSRIGEMKC